MNMKERLTEIVGKNIFIDTIGADKASYSEQGKLLETTYSDQGKLLEIGDDYLILECVNEEGTRVIGKNLYPFHSIAVLGGYDEDIFLKKITPVP